MRFLKRIVLLGVFGLMAWGMYQAGRNDLFSFWNSKPAENVQVAKKEWASKSKSSFKKARDVVPAPVKEYNYTFLETLEDVDIEKYVDLDGKVKVMKKTVHSWVDEVDKVIHEPRVLLAAYKEAGGESDKPSSSYKEIIRKLDELMKKEPKRKVAPSPAPSSSVKRAVPSARKGQPYRVQVSSFRKLNSARVMKSDLRKKGYPAFIVSVQISKGKGIWYRVYLGEYPTEERARAAANQARRRHKLRPIVLKVAKK